MAKRCLNSLKIGEVVYPLSSIDDYSFLGTNDYGETQVPPQRNTFIDIPSTFHLTSEPTFKIESDLTKKTYQIGNGGVLDYPRESGTDSYYGLYTGWLFYNQSTVLCGDRFYPNYNFTKSTYLVIVVDDDTEDAWIVHISMNYDGKIRYFHLHPKNGNENILYTIFRTGIADSGGAGSGYIGNTLVSNKKMVGYNVPTSSAESTKTESVEDASESPVSGKPKIGNGYAKIRFLRPLEEKSIVAEMLASNQLKVNGDGEAPTITSGSFGTYDSATDSYYFANNCRMDWKNWSALGVDLDKISRLTKIEFEWEGQIRNTSYGHNFDAQMQTYFNTNLLFINGIADGYYDAGSDYQKFARIKNDGSDQWQTTEEVPFNNSSYQNAFHKVKWVWEIENSVAKKITIYLDNVVFCTYTDIDYEFEITALGNQFLRCDVIDHTNVKSIKIAFYYMG